MNSRPKISVKKIVVASVLLLVIAFGVFITTNWDKFARIQEVELVEVDCSEKSRLLEEVYLSDQRIRNGKVPFLEFVKEDHRNLEIVISIIEKCGMPTLEEVSSKQMDAVWLALQHAPDPKHAKEYFPLIEESVERGDLSKKKYATMLDRILMHEGEPQIYGSQIENGKLYELEEPGQVNERRKQMGMQPIEAYLKTFNIKFDKVEK